VERLATVADSIYVMSSADIRRSGATSIPDALRLVPGVQVARIDANKWAIGIRGFASRLARSVLVLIDGRTVYNPLFAGTYWEIQDTLLEDVDRIEVIRPGGTLWERTLSTGSSTSSPRRRRRRGRSRDLGGSEEQGFAGALRRPLGRGPPLPGVRQFPTATPARTTAFPTTTIGRWAVGFGSTGGRRPGTH
jgi:iron complex outermembrane receptor protein